MNQCIQKKSSQPEKNPKIKWMGEDWAKIQVTFPRRTEAGEELADICKKRAAELYGDPIPGWIEARMTEELNGICRDPNADILLFFAKLIKGIREKGGAVFPRGCVSGSFTAFLSGITEINPLKAHYICPSCHYIEKSLDEEIGLDLKDKRCPMCKTPLKKDGFRIPYQSYFGQAFEKEADMSLSVSKGAMDAIPEIISELAGCKDESSRGLNCGDGEGSPEISLKIHITYNRQLLLLERLYELTGLKPEEIILNESTLFTLFSSETALGLQNILAFHPDISPVILKAAAPRSVFDCINLFGFYYGAGVWKNNAERLLMEGYRLSELIGFREAIFDKLYDDGMSAKSAYCIMEHVRKGKGLTPEMEEDMEEFCFKDAIVESCKKISYLWPKGHLSHYVLNALRLAYYKICFQAAYGTAVCQVGDAPHLVHRIFYNLLVGMRMINGG